MSNDGGPAFPVDGGDVQNGGTGMSLRDWFAGMAIAGMSASPAFFDQSADIMAAVAYEQADAMLSAREEQ